MIFYTLHEIFNALDVNINDEKQLIEDQPTKQN
jgi:hypothetical protein